MKFLSLLASCLFILNSVQAQNISAGFKAGMQRQFSLIDKFQEPDNATYYVGDLRGPRNSITTEVFTRYSLKRRWSFELSISHQSAEYTATSHYSQFYNWQSKVNEERLSLGKGTFTIFNTVVLYNLTGGKTRKLNTYVGLSISPTYNRVVGKEYLKHDEKQIIIPKSLQYQDWDALYGVSQSFSYQIAPNLLLVNNISLKFSQQQFMNNRLNEYRPYSFLDFQIGAAYQFNLN